MGIDALDLPRRPSGFEFLTAMVLALVGAIKSLLAAVASDQLTGTRRDNPQELRALASANIVSGLCGGLALVLMRARAVLLINAGGRGRATPIAAALAIALRSGAGSSLVVRLPNAVRAGIVVTIAISLIDRWSRRRFGQLLDGKRLRDPRSSLFSVSIVCVNALEFGLAVAILAGTLLAVLVFLFCRNRSMLRSRFMGAEPPSRRACPSTHERLLRALRARIHVLELDDTLIFANVERLFGEVDPLPPDVRVFLFNVRRVSTIDESGAVWLDQLALRLQRRGVALLLTGMTAEHDHGQHLHTVGYFARKTRQDWFRDAALAIEAGEHVRLTEAGVAEPQPAVALENSNLLRGLTEARRERAAGHDRAETGSRQHAVSSRRSRRMPVRDDARLDVDGGPCRAPL